MQPDLLILCSSSEAADLPYPLLKLSKEAPWRRGKNISYTSTVQPLRDLQQHAPTRVPHPLLPPAPYAELAVGWKRQQEGRPRRAEHF